VKAEGFLVFAGGKFHTENQEKSLRRAGTRCARKFAFLVSVWYNRITKKGIQMATVKDLISQLEQIEDKDQSIIFQYFLAEHFEFSDLGEVRQPTAEQFDQVADDLDDSSLWDDPAETINDYVFELINRDNEANKDEDDE
jgi:hypothetical protein